MNSFVQSTSNAVESVMQFVGLVTDGRIKHWLSGRKVGLCHVDLRPSVLHATWHMSRSQIFPSFSVCCSVIADGCKTKSRTQNFQPTPDCLQSVTAQCCVQSRAVEWLMFLIALMHAIDNYFNRAYSAVEYTLTLLSYRIVLFINTSVRLAYYVVCCHQQTTTHLIYKMWPLSNLPSINFNSLSAENYYSSAATAT